MRFDVSPADPLVFVGVGVVLARNSSVARLMTALRSTRTERLEAFRRD